MANLGLGTLEYLETLLSLKMLFILDLSVVTAGVDVAPDEF
jgi:hypothetical protein